MPQASVKYQHRVLGLLSLLSIIAYLDRVCIAVAGPKMQDSLQISPQSLGLGNQRLFSFLQRFSRSPRA